MSQRTEEERKKHRDYMREYNKRPHAHAAQVARRANYYQKHKEQIRTKVKQWEEDHTEWIRVRRKSKYEQNKKEVLQKCKAYRDTHKSDKKQRDKAYRDSHSEECKAVSTSYYKSNKLRLAKYRKLWARDNRPAVNASRRRSRKRLYATPLGKIKACLRARLSSAIKSVRGARKSYRALNLVGCTLPHLKCHIENQWLPFMTWDNFGKWHIHHKMPVSTFDLLQPSEQKKCFHWTNLTPVWATIHLNKIHGIKHQAFQHNFDYELL